MPWDRSGVSRGHNRCDAIPVMDWLETSLVRKGFRELKRRVKKLTGRSWFVSMDYRYQKLAIYLRGWTNYFGI